jgi:hypothetical protein
MAEKKLALGEPVATHYDIVVNAPVNVANTILLPNTKNRIKAKWLPDIPVGNIITSVALTLTD